MQIFILNTFAARTGIINSDKNSWICQFHTGKQFTDLENKTKQRRHAESKVDKISDTLETSPRKLLVICIQTGVCVLITAMHCNKIDAFASAQYNYHSKTLATQIIKAN
jgi:hypothetical protein